MNWQMIREFSYSADWILLTAFHSLWFSFTAFAVMRYLKLRSSVVRSAWGICTLLALFTLPFITLSLPQFAVRTQPPVRDTAVGTSTTIVDIQAPLVNRLSTAETALPQTVINRWKLRINQCGALWLAIALFAIGRLSYQLAFLKGYCIGLQKVQDDRISAILKENNYLFRFRRKPRFFTSNKLASPISAGIFAPMVILPTNLYRSIGDIELRAVLLHELAHIYQHDHALGLLQRAIKALYWWNPFVYGLCNSLSVAREELSDNYAILGIRSAANYARLLIGLVEKTSVISRMPCTSGLRTPYQSLEARIQKILSKERDMRVKIDKCAMSIILLTTVLLCCVVMIGSQVVVFGIDSQAPPSGQKSIKPQAAPMSGKPISPYWLSKMLVRQVPPEYPGLAIEKRVQGRVELGIEVDKEGLVSELRTIKGHPLFSEAASTAVKQWIFHPCMVGGSKTPVSGKVAPPAHKLEVNRLPFSVTIILDFRLGKADLPKIVSSAADYNINFNSLR